MTSRRNIWLVTLAVMCAAALMVSCDDEEVVEECPSNLSAIQILAPATGATLQVGQAVTIKWCYPTDFSMVQIEFSADGGEVWTVITADGGISKPVNTFSWTPQATHVTTVGYFQIAQYGNTDETKVLVGPIVITQ